MIPSILQSAQIDEVIKVPEKSAIEMCHRLIKDHGLFVGGSSGSVIAAIETYFKNKVFTEPPTVLTIFADNGWCGKPESRCPCDRKSHQKRTRCNGRWERENFILAIQGR